MTRTAFMVSLGVALGLFGCSDASTAGDPADTQMSQDVTAGDPAESDALETPEDTAITPSADVQDVSITADASPDAQDASVEDSATLSDGTSSQDAEEPEDTEASGDVEAPEDTEALEDVQASEDTEAGALELYARRDFRLAQVVRARRSA